MMFDKNRFKEIIAEKDAMSYTIDKTKRRWNILSSFFYFGQLVMDTFREKKQKKIDITCGYTVIKINIWKHDFW